MGYKFKNMIQNQFTREKFDIPEVCTDLTNNIDFPYHKLLTKILKNGVLKENRTGVKTYSIFGPQIEFRDVNLNFPLISTRKILTKSVLGELLWFLSGSTNKHDLENKYGVKIWKHWGDDETGEMGPIYGNQWVNWEYWEPKSHVSKFNKEYVCEKKSINQLQDIIETLKINPDDRRMIVSTWDPSIISHMALPPCHWSFQFYSVQYPNEEKRRLSVKMHQRSVDSFVGLPFNIASYAFLLHMIANEVNMIPQDLFMSFGDTHIYENHIEYIIKQLNRNSKSINPPKLNLLKKDFWNYTLEDFDIEGYDPYPNWKNIPIAV